MLTITIQVNAPAGSAMAVKEALAMHLERFGDTRVISIKETEPEQMGFSNMAPNKNRR